VIPKVPSSSERTAVLASIKKVFASSGLNVQLGQLSFSFSLVSVTASGAAGSEVK